MSSSHRTFSQVQKHKAKQERKTEETVEAKHHDTEDTAGLMEEIDELLETNAEAFVKGYVQRGGQ